MLAAVTALIAVTACGSDDDDGGQVSTPGTAGPGQTGAPATDAPGSTSGDGGPGTTGAGDETGPTLPPNVDREATLKYNYTFLPASADPHKAHPSAAGNDWLYDRLLVLDGDKNLHPGLALSWETSEDRLTMTLELRPGVKFRDGSDLDAEDVKASLERGKTLEGSTVAPFLRTIDTVEVIDPMTVELHLATPDPTLVYNLASSAGSVLASEAIASNANLDAADVGAGSTPYKLVQFESGKSFFVERDPNAPEYWDPAAWSVKRFELTNISDPVAQINAVRTGAIDVGWLRRNEAQTTSELQGTDLIVYSQQSENGRNLSFRASRVSPFFSDPEVRRAVAQALDWKSLVESGATGIDCTPITQFFPVGSPGYIEDYAPLAYDPDAARPVLEATGGFSFEVVTPQGGALEEAAAQFLQQSLADYDIDVTITPMTINEQQADFIAGNRDAYLGGIAGYPDPTIVLTNLYTSFIKTADADAPKVEEMMNAANEFPLGSPERAEKLEEVNRYTLEQAWSVPICFSKSTWAAKPNIVGLDTMAETWGGTTHDTRYWAVLED